MRWITLWLNAETKLKEIEMGEILQLGVVLVVIAVLLAIGPWCFIWAINTLVAAGGVTTFVIPFTFWTWLAAAIIGGMAIIPSMRRG